MSQSAADESAGDQSAADESAADEPAAKPAPTENPCLEHFCKLLSGGPTDENADERARLQALGISNAEDLERFVERLGSRTLNDGIKLTSERGRKIVSEAQKSKQELIAQGYSLAQAHKIVLSKQQSTAQH